MLFYKRTLRILSTEHVSRNEVLVKMESKRKLILHQEQTVGISTAHNTGRGLGKSDSRSRDGRQEGQIKEKYNMLSVLE